MNFNRILKYALILGLILGLAAYPVRSQGGGPLPGPDQPAQSDAVISPLMSYQGRLTESGVPVTGDRSLTFRLFTVATGGTAVWTEGPEIVPVEHGLFSTTLGDLQPLPLSQMDEALWLEIQVGPTLLPRQRLTGAPYAMSLAPNADITSSDPTGSALYVEHTANAPAVHGYSVSDTGVFGNSSTGHGLQAESSGTGAGGTALWALNDNPAGIAIWGVNDSLDSTLVVSNNGSGLLMKGFGPDGGEDEFRLGNDGRIESKADSYLFYPGCGSVHPLLSSPNGDAVCAETGVAVVYGNTTGFHTLAISLPLPAVLYGQPLKVREMIVYYRTSNSDTYIAEVHVHRQQAAGNPDTWIMGSLYTDQNSTVYTSFAVPTPNHNILDPETGVLMAAVTVYIDETVHGIIIGAVRLRVGHHGLY